MKFRPEGSYKNRFFYVGFYCKLRVRIIVGKVLRKNFFCGKENHERINAAAKRLQAELGVWGGAVR